MEDISRADLQKEMLDLGREIRSVKDLLRIFGRRLNTEVRLRDLQAACEQKQEQLNMTAAGFKAGHEYTKRLEERIAQLSSELYTSRKECAELKAGRCWVCQSDDTTNSCESCGGITCHEHGHGALEDLYFCDRCPTDGDHDEG